MVYNAVKEIFHPATDEGKTATKKNTPMEKNILSIPGLFIPERT